MTMIDPYDEQRDRQAHDLILKLIEDGMSEQEALATWEKEQGICPECKADRGVYLDQLGEPCWHGHKERR